VVDHKLGERAGMAAAEGLHTVGNVLEGAYAFAMMGPRAVAKRGLAASLKQTAGGGGGEPSSSSATSADLSRSGHTDTDRADGWMLRDLNECAPVLPPHSGSAVVEASQCQQLWASDEPRPSMEPF